MTSPIIEVQGLHKTYASGHVALKALDLEIRRGEISALLDQRLPLELLRRG